MPRYFFHTSDGVRHIDDEGIELADDAAARREAVRYGGDLLGDDLDMLVADRGLRVEVTDGGDAFVSPSLSPPSICKRFRTRSAWLVDRPIFCDHDLRNGLLENRQRFTLDCIMDRLEASSAAVIGRKVAA